MDLNCFIAPEKRQAKQIATMISRQGDGRGFILDEEDTLVIFDSYGNTHHSASVKLRVYHPLCLIFRKDGGIYVDCSFKGDSNREVPLENVFRSEHCDFFRTMYKHMGINSPYATRWDY